MLETTNPGTDYNAFYFQGPNIIISMFVGAVSQLSYLNQISDGFNLLVDLSLTFKFFFVYLLSLTLFGIYFISTHTYENEVITILASIMFIPFFGLAIADNPSIGVCISFLFLSVFFVYLDSSERTDFNKVDWLFFSLITTSIFLIHIISVGFMVLFSIIMSYWKFLKGTYRTKQILKNLALITVTGLFSLLFLSFFHLSLLQGIMDEINRKILTGVSYNYGFTWFYTQYIVSLRRTFSTLLLPLEISSLIFAVIGFFLYRKNKCSAIVSLIFTSLLFTLIPILPSLIKIEWYLIYPISILGGTGLFHIISKVGNRIWVIFFIYLFAGTVLSTKNVYEVALRRRYWYRYDLYKEIYNLSSWLNSKLDSAEVILFPESGPFAYLLNILCHQKILFAEPRFPDIPSFQETSKIYLEYPTIEGEFNYENISYEERYNILRKYNISVIIETSSIKADTKFLKIYYLKGVLFNWYHPTPSYWVIILHHIPKSLRIEEKELLSSPIRVNLPAGPQCIKIDITGRWYHWAQWSSERNNWIEHENIDTPTTEVLKTRNNLSRDGILALRVINNNNVSKKFLAKIIDIDGKTTENVIFNLQHGNNTYYIYLNHLTKTIDFSNTSSLILCFSWWEQSKIDLVIDSIKLVSKND